MTDTSTPTPGWLREDVLSDYAALTPSRENLDRFLATWPQYARDLIDLHALLVRPPTEDTGPLSDADRVLVARAWERHVAAAPASPEPDDAPLIDTTPTPTMDADLETWIDAARRCVAVVPADMVPADWTMYRVVRLADQLDDARADLARLRAALRALSEKWKHPPEGSDNSQYWVGKRTAYVLAAHELDGLLPPVPIVDVEDAP